MCDQTEMDWIPVEQGNPNDTARQSTLWLCLKTGEVVRGGFIKAMAGSAADGGYWFNTDGHAVDGVAYWLPVISTQSPHPPIL